MKRVGVALALVLLLLSAGCASVSQASPTEALAWIWIERATILGAAGITAGRIALALSLGLIGGSVLARLMRLNRRSEAVLTPWLLTFLAIPWVLVMVAVNIIPTFGLNEHTALAAAAAAGGVQIWALGRRKLEDRREQYLKRAFWYGTTAVLAAELLTRTDGLGAQLRFYTLFTQFDHLIVYAVVTAFVCLGVRVLQAMCYLWIKKTFLWHSGR